jgi:hypothetical protein
MIGLLCFVLAVLASPFKSKLRLEAENAVLRHPLNLMRRRLPGRVRPAKPTSPALSMQARKAYLASIVDAVIV